MSKASNKKGAASAKAVVAPSLASTTTESVIESDVQVVEPVSPENAEPTVDVAVSAVEVDSAATIQFTETELPVELVIVVDPIEVVDTVKESTALTEAVVAAEPVANQDPAEAKRMSELNDVLMNDGPETAVDTDPDLISPMGDESRGPSRGFAGSRGDDGGDSFSERLPTDNESTVLPLPLSKTEAALPPMVGRVLTCMAFEHGPIGGRVIEENEHAIKLRLDGGRTWPVPKKRIVDDTWIHAEGDYPPVGTDKGFDTEYRPESVAVVVAAPAGYIKARVRAEGFVQAKGFELNGASKSTWRKDDIGYIPEGVVSHPRSNFVRMVDQTIKASAIESKVKVPLGHKLVEGDVAKEDHILARVRAPHGGHVAAKGITVDGALKMVWKDGDVGLFPISKVNTPKSMLISA